MTDIHDLYIEAVEGGILAAGGGEEGAVDVTVAALACVAVAASCIAMLPPEVAAQLVKHVRKSLPGLVEGAQNDAKEYFVDGLPEYVVTQ